jgi:hypothetical protein
MQFLVVTNCSSRKTALPTPALAASSLPRGTKEQLCTEWINRIRRARATTAAQDLYVGRSFCLVKQTVIQCGALLAIVSAGLGLLGPGTEVPSYNLTITPGPNCIMARASHDTNFQPQDWWRLIRVRGFGYRSLKRLLQSAVADLVIISLTRPYLRLISDELYDLDAPQLERLRIVGPKSVEFLPEPIRPLVLPYDDRLNDPGLALRGTEMDFAARSLVHFVSLVCADRKIFSAGEHARRVRLSLSHLCAPKHPVRMRLSDESLSNVLSRLKQQCYAETTALRFLRDRLNVSCEKNRFVQLWRTT